MSNDALPRFEQFAAIRRYGGNTGFSLAWSSDSKAIAYVTNISGQFNVPRSPQTRPVILQAGEHTHLVATAQWLSGTDRPDTALTAARQRGESAFVELRQGLEGWAAIGRFDRFDPDRSTPANSDRRAIAGIAYWLKWARSRVGFVLNDEDVRYDAGAHKPDENRLLLQTHIQF